MFATPGGRKKSSVRGSDRLPQYLTGQTPHDRRRWRLCLMPDGGSEALASVMMMIINHLCQLQSQTIIETFYVSDSVCLMTAQKAVQVRQRGPAPASVSVTSPSPPG
jgi:hypothetical protein